MNFGKLLLVGLTSLMITPSSWALVGGPWDHLIKDVYSRRNTDGLYEASITMKNGSGFLRFASAVNRGTLADPPITNTSTAVVPNRAATATLSGSARMQTLLSDSNSVIFYRGNAYYGSVFGSVNAQSKSVNGGGGGQSLLMESLEADLGNPLISNTAPNTFARNLNNVRGFSESMNLHFSGKVVKDSPEIRFEAKGEAVFFSRPQLKVTQVVYEPSVPPTTAVEPEAIYQVEVVDQGFVKSDASEKIRLFGGRVGLQTTFNPVVVAAQPPAQGGN